MARHGGYKAEKRRKETARLKKQEEKRQRRFGAKAEEAEGDPGTGLSESEVDESGGEAGAPENREVP